MWNRSEFIFEAIELPADEVVKTFEDARHQSSETQEPPLSTNQLSRDETWQPLSNTY